MAARGRQLKSTIVSAEGELGLLAYAQMQYPMMKIILMISAVLMSWSSNATAQETQETLRQWRVGHCVADLRKLCPGVVPGNNRLRACLREHLNEVSYPCLVSLAKFAEVRNTLNGECSAHLQQQCGNVKRKEGQFGTCLRSAVASLSDNCKDALARAVPGAHKYPQSGHH